MCACAKGSTHAQKGGCMHTGTAYIWKNSGLKLNLQKKNHILSVKTLKHLITKMSLQPTKQAARSDQCEWYSLDNCNFFFLSVKAIIARRERMALSLWARTDA